MEKTLLEKIAAFSSRNLENAPSLGGQAEALLREALKDVNDKMHQVFFGQTAGMGESGTPLVPTQMMVNQDLGAVGSVHDGLSDPGKYQQLLDGYSTKGPTAQLHDRGHDR